MNEKTRSRVRKINANREFCEHQLNQTRRPLKAWHFSIAHQNKHNKCSLFSPAMNLTRSLLSRQLPRFVSTVTSQSAPVSETARDDDLYRYLKIKCSSHETEVLDSYEKFLTLAAEHLNIKHVQTETPFRTIKRRTLLASRFVKKKYRVQYESRSYYRDLTFKDLTGSTADTFLEYIQRNLPEGVLMIAEKHRLAELPFDLNDPNGTVDEKEAAREEK